MRIIFLLLGILYSFYICAQEITQSEALSKGKEFLMAKKEYSNPSTRSNSESTFELAYTGKKDGKVGFYVYNCESGGFVIVSADAMSVESILGYSLTGYFDYENLNPTAKYWIESYKNNIEDRKLQNHIKNRSRLFTKTTEPLLGSTAWGQGNPFNLMCPEVDGKKCVTGCVATAMAQVMYYHKWPEHGEGNISYISQYGHDLSADLSESNYNWNIMLPNYYNSSYSEDSANAVALLMRDCGYSIHANYGLDSTGADFHGYSLCEYFNYDKGIRQMSYECYDPDEWDSILKTEIDERRPVLYGCVIEGGGGHAIVCDGYDNDGYFHMNFGWGGAADGYYLTSAGYPIPTDMMCGIERNHGGDSAVEFAAVSGLSYKDNAISVKAVLSNVEKKDVIVAIAYENINTKEIDYIGSYTSNTSDNPIARFFTFYDDAIVPDGDYIVYPVCKKISDDSEWNKCHFKGDSKSVFNVSVKNGVKHYQDEGELNLPEGMVYNNGLYYFIDDTSKTAKVTCHEDYKGMYAGDISIPEYIEIKGIQYRVSAIGEEAFNDCGWMSVSLPRSIKRIEKNAFRSCYLTNFLIPSDSELEIIEDFSFEYCHFDFHELNLPSKLNFIGKRAFNMENFKILSIPSSVNHIGEEAFRACNRIRDINVFWELPIDYPYSIFTDISASHVKLHVPDGTSTKYKSSPTWSVFNICEGALMETDIELDGLTYVLRFPEMTASLKSSEFYNNKNLHLPERIDHDQKEYKLTIIDDMALAGYDRNKISYAFIPNTIEELRMSVFSDQDELLSVDIEGKSSLWIIGGSCFYNCCNLQSIHLPIGLKKIDVFAFYNCLSLKSVDIPSSVDEICQDAFQKCLSLEDIYVHWDEPLLIHSLAFEDVNYSNVRLHVPKGTKNKYSRLAPWSLFGQIIEDTEPVNDILVESIILSQESRSGEKGESFTIEATVLPENAYNKSLRWTSSDESIALVDNTGLVTLLTEGNCIITATALDGSKIHSECLVNCGADVEGINAEMSSDNNWYTIDGLRVTKPTHPGLYIQKDKKIIVK